MTMKIPTKDFDLRLTLDCGQVFRWQHVDGWWVGIVGGRIVRVRQTGAELEVDTKLSRDAIIRYFRLDDDMPDIYRRINKDDIMDGLIRRFRGMRLIRQEPWECLISYMASSCKSIPNIKDSISNLCISYGEDIGGYYSFPDARSLACTTEQQLRRTKLGFRAVNILKAAQCVEQGLLDLGLPFELDYPAAREMLMRVRGIGPKIADCVLLFAYEKLEAFPADTHILSVMNDLYGHYLEVPQHRLSDAIGKFAREYFGTYAGYAQQYLYYSRISGRSELPVCP